MKSLLFEGFKSYYKKLEEEANNKVALYTYQSQDVLDTLKKGKTYYASYDRGMFSNYKDKNPYKMLSKELGINSCPIFCAKSESDLEDIAYNSGLDFWNRELLTLEVPKNEIVYEQDFWEWDDFINKVLYNETNDEYEEYLPQFILDRIEPEWLKKSLEEETHRRKPIYLYRGVAPTSFSKNFKPYAGLFFTPKKYKASGWGHIKRYLLKGDAKIYNKEESSGNFCQNNGYFDKEYKEFKECFGMYFGDVNITKISDFTNLNLEDSNKLDDLVNKIAGYNFCWYDIIGWCTQLVAKIELEKQGYDGAYWTYEDYGNPEQYQIWNLDVLKSYEGVVESVEDRDDIISEGNQLTTKQVEFFKDSKIRDKNGNLLVCYHNTPFDFKAFDKTKIGSGNGGASFGKGFYFSIGDDVSSNYDGDYTLQCYLNITNPFNYYNCHIEDIKNLLDNSNYAYDKEVLDNIDDGYLEDADLIDNILDDVLIDDNPYEVFSDMVKNAGYDGIIAGEEVIAFEPNQIKRISNTNPTSKDDMNEEI